MRINRSLFIFVFFALTLTCHAQCDRRLYDELRRGADAPFSLLKCYSIQSRRIEGVPFSAQYSYVLTKGTTYGLLMKHSGKSEKEFLLTLTDNNGIVLNDAMKKVTIKREMRYIYKAPTTGIYYLTVHANESFDGCAVLQLSFARDEEKLLTSQQTSFKHFFQSTPLPANASLLKEFVVPTERKSEYTFVLDAKKRYALVTGKQDEGANINFMVRSATETPITRTLIGNGVQYQVIRPQDTGIYYFEFDNQDPDAIAMARLLELKGRIE